VAETCSQPHRLEWHPAACLFPLMADADLNRLADDIRESGLQQPIVMHEGKVLDGRNRFLACHLADIEPRFVDWDGDGSPVAWVLSQNLHRRHLTDTERKFIAAEASELFEAEARERQGTRTDLAADRQRSDMGRSVEKAAAHLGVAPREVAKAKRVKKKAPVLAQAVADGTASLDAASELVDEPEEVQRELVKAGNRAVKEAAKAKRKGRLSEAERARLSAIARGEEPETNENDEPDLSTEDAREIAVTVAIGPLAHLETIWPKGVSKKALIKVLNYLLKRCEE
jgi:hypothetical protein